MRENQVHSSNIVKWAKDKPETIVISGDLTASTEITKFSETYPDRFFCLGMAEQNMLSFAGGMAREGFVPLLHTFSVFLTRRPYDQLAMSVCYPDLPVILCGFLPGLLTPGGVTHQAIEDVNMMRGLPNMTVLETGDAADVESVLDVAYETQGPVYIRMLRGQIPRLFDTPMKFNTARTLSSGEDVIVLTSGIMTEEFLKTKKVWESRGLTVTHLHITTLKPFDDPIVDKVLLSAKCPIVTIENHNIYGGLGSCVAERMATLGVGQKLLRIAVPDRFGHGASLPYLLDTHDMSARHIVRRIGDHIGVDLQKDAVNLIVDDVEEIDQEISSDQLEAL